MHSIHNIPELFTIGIFSPDILCLFFFLTALNTAWFVNLVSSE